MARFILWFRNDLRTHDNAILARAMERLRCGACTEVLPVFVFDPRQFAALRDGFHKTGPFRGRFLLEAVRDLKDRLRALGSDLLVAVGRPEDVLPQLLGPARTTILAQEEVTSEEIAVDRAVVEACGERATLELLWGSTLIHRTDLPFPIDGAPDVFTQFRKRIEERSQPRDLLPMPSPLQMPLPAIRAWGDYTLDFVPTWEDLPELGRSPAPVDDPRAVLRFVGGETAALSRLAYYVHGENRLLARYFDTRNGMLGGDYSTKLGPWLSLGCISPRLVFHEVRRFELTTGLANKSTYWVVFELLWRDYFRFYAAKHGNAIFRAGGPTNSPQRWPRDMDAFRRWASGETGAPLVDACMRELAATGFMSNRGRQNVASYLVHDMGVDWRLGAAFFESTLIDYDACSNWGNWVAAAGLTGGRINRFNVAKQAAEYDPHGLFVRCWLGPSLSPIRKSSPIRLSDSDSAPSPPRRDSGSSSPPALSSSSSSSSSVPVATGSPGKPAYGPETAAARWSQPRYARPARSFQPRSDFERFSK